VELTKASNVSTVGGFWKNVMLIFFMFYKRKNERLEIIDNFRLSNFYMKLGNTIIKKRRNV